MNLQKTIFFVVGFLVFVGEASAKDLFLTNQVENITYQKDGKVLHRIPDFFKVKSLVDVATGEETLVTDPSVQKMPCTFGDEFFGICGNLKFDKSGFFQDISALPITNGASSFKISVVRYNMHLGGDLYIPFSLLSSEVAGSIDQEKINSLKLLDPEQGKLNLKWSYAARYHIGDFGKFRENERGMCAIGINFGVRYLGLEETDRGDLNKTDNTNAIGGYIELSNSWIFPIFEIDKASKDAGQLAIKISGTYYYQNIDDSTILFPDAVDSAGNPLEFDKEFYGYNAIANLSITDKISIQASYFKASSHDQLDSETTLTISYDF